MVLACGVGNFLCNMKQAKKQFRNFVAKNMKQCGAGVHKAKQGRFASRARVKDNLIKGKE